VPPHPLSAIVTLLPIACAVIVHGAANANPVPNHWVEVVPGEVLVHQQGREALHARLRDTVFRAEATQPLPDPYVGAPLRYDGAVVAIRVDDEDLFLTSAAWLTGAETIVLHHLDAQWPLVVERVDHRFDLALLRWSTHAPPHVEAITIAKATPMVLYALLSPQTPYEQLATASVSPHAAAGELHWRATIAATNGYPLFNAQAELVAVVVARSTSAPTKEGLAIGWPVIQAFLEPDPDRADARLPDRVHEHRQAPVPATSVEAPYGWWVGQDGRR